MPEVVRTAMAATSKAQTSDLPNKTISFGADVNKWGAPVASRAALRRPPWACPASDCLAIPCWRTAHVMPVPSRSSSRCGSPPLAALCQRRLTSVRETWARSTRLSRASQYWSTCF
jgi:hypothetical protein